MKASFGTDGQPGSYADVDDCDALALFGHNVAETQTVLWMRMLDRLHGPDRPRLLCVDPRPTPVAREADVHLAPRVGTNVGLMNGLLRELIHHGWIDEDYVARHAIGFERLRQVVEPYTPERVGEMVHLAHYLGLLHRSQTELARALREVAAGHGEEVDVAERCERFARECDRHAERLRPFAERYGEDAPDEPERLHAAPFAGTRSGGIGLLRDLHDLYLMATECDLCWMLVRQAAQGARDRELLAVVGRCEDETAAQLAWLRTRMKEAAPQALVVAP